MANIGHGKKFENARAKIINSALKIFLEKGYEKAKISDITFNASLDNNAVARCFGDKETLFSCLVERILEEQKAMALELAKEQNDSLIVLFVDCAIRFYMAENSEEMREIMQACYTLDKALDITNTILSKRLEVIFGLKNQDFYAISVALNGIMRGFLSEKSGNITTKNKVENYTNFACKLLKFSEKEEAKLLQFIQELDLKSTPERVEKRLLSNTFDGGI